MYNNILDIRCSWNMGYTERDKWRLNNVSFSFFFANHRQAMYTLMVETKVSTFANFSIYIMETYGLSTNGGAL